MIKLRVITESGLYPRTAYTCCKCATTEVFYSVAPHTCEGCHTSIPDICRIRDNINARIGYHKTENRYLW